MAKIYATILGPTLVLFTMTGCYESDLASRSRTEGGVSSRKPAEDVLGSRDTAKDEAGDKTAVKKKKKKKKATSGEESTEEGDDELQQVSPADKAPEVFPKLAFNGVGFTTYKLEDQLAMAQSVLTDLNASTLVLATTQAYVSCSGISGCDQGDVDNNVRASMIGANIYTRVTKEHMDALIASGFKKAPFAIFATDVTAKNGTKFTLSSPAPAYLLPVPEGRFAILDQGPMTWTSHVTTDRPFATQPDGPADRSDFDISITITKIAVNGAIVAVKSDLTIPQDGQGDPESAGMIYKIFPIAKSTTFTLDTASQTIPLINLEGWSNGDRSQQLEKTLLNFKLCSKTTPGSAPQMFDCR